ncbi:MAG: hypothetical protein QGI88_03395, partial [SAR202 cluster bacterium]|nr:hypothetical protein [SAR202 cluster bacterium]
MSTSKDVSMGNPCNCHCQVVSSDGRQTASGAGCRVVTGVDSLREPVSGVAVDGPAHAMQTNQPTPNKIDQTVARAKRPY